MRFFLTSFFLLLLSIPSYGTSRHVVASKNIDQIVIQQKVVQFDDFGQLRVVAIPVTSYGPQYYYEAAPLRRDNKLSDEDIQKIIDGVVAGVIQQIEVVGDGGNTTEKPATKPDVPSTPTPVTNLESQVLTLFVNKCATCHTEGSPKGKLALLNKDDTMGKLTDRQVSKIIRRTEGGAGIDENHMMPLGGPALPQEDIDLLKRWQDERFAQPVAEIQEETLTNEVP